MQERPLLSLSISLIPSTNGATLDVDTLARLVEQELHITERRTYADAIERGLCAPIQCVIVNASHGEGRKRRRLIDARER